MMATLSCVKRAVACVDGLWFDSEGQLGSESGNNSNIYRLWASVRQGTIIDKGDRQIEQVCRYFGGRGRGKPSNSNAKAFNQRVQEVLKFCCDNTQSADDELWLFGFSKGANIVVNAVAELLRLRSAHFESPETESRRTWYGAKRPSAQKLPTRPSWNRKEQPIPEIKFLGLFDMLNDVKLGALDNVVSLATGTQIRHAVALNEQQQDLSPTLLSGKDTSDEVGRASVVESWFVGTHIDIGGGAKDDGLSLYPLQWILIESENLGLVFYESESPVPSPKLTDLLFPSDRTNQGPSTPLSKDSDDAPRPGRWDFAYSNGIHVEMHDLRMSHKQGNLQRPAGNKITKKRQSYRISTLGKRSSSTGEPSPASPTPTSPPAAPKRMSLTFRRKSAQEGQKVERSEAPESVAETPDSSPIRQIYNEQMTPQHHAKINKTSSVIKTSSVVAVTSRSQPRYPFQSGKSGKLTGYCENAPCGSIIHPSVYFLAYAYRWIDDALKATKEEARNLKEFKQSRLGRDKLDPWLTEHGMETKEACRILVCGACGVGKSTLLNSVFGIPMTEERRDVRGIHDVNIGLESDRQPGIIIHDSRGFESGGLEEVKLLKEFLSKHLKAKDKSQQLDAIWLCILSTQHRKFQTAEEKLIEELREHSSNVPLILVCTQKDEFLTNREGHARTRIKAQRDTDGLPALDEPTLDREARCEAECELLKDKEETEQRLQKALMPGAKILYTSTAKDDPSSIQVLIRETLRQVRSRRPQASVPLAGAQVLSATAKVKQAVDESVRFLYQDTSGWRAMAKQRAQDAARLIPLGDATLTPILARILCNRIVKCFGFPDIKPETVADIMTKVIFRNLARFVTLSFGLDFWNWGARVSGIFLPFAPPALKYWPAARMILKCACDMIIILDRAFALQGVEATHKDVVSCMVEYAATNDAAGNVKQSKRGLVHKEVGQYFPMEKKKIYPILNSRSKTRRRILKVVVKHRFADDEPESQVDQAALNGMSGDTPAVDEDSLFADDLQAAANMFGGGGSNLSTSAGQIDGNGIGNGGGVSGGVNGGIKQSVNSEPSTTANLGPMNGSTTSGSVQDGNGIGPAAGNSDSDEETDSDFDFDIDEGGDSCSGGAGDDVDSALGLDLHC